MLVGSVGTIRKAVGTRSISAFLNPTCGATVVVWTYKSSGNQKVVM